MTRGEARLAVRAGKGFATLNGQEVPIGAPVTIENGRMMIPLALLKAALGFGGRWDAASGKPAIDDRATAAMDVAKALAAVAAQLKQGGPLVQVSLLGKSTSAVHDNVRLLAVIGQVPFDTTILFDADGLVDDFYMNVYAGPITPRGAPS